MEGEASGTAIEIAGGKILRVEEAAAPGRNDNCCP